MHTGYARLIVKGVCTSAVCASKMLAGHKVKKQSLPRENVIATALLDIEALVKASVGTLLGGGAKDSIMRITRIQIPF
jgi:hypothetical protein